jgi:DNA-binding response OmpR family regulator
VLVDLDSEGSRAEKTLRWLRKDRELASVPIVMLGAEDQNDLVAQGYRAGANACLLKPLAEDAMNEIARNIGDYAYLLQIKPDAQLIHA